MNTTSNAAEIRWSDHCVAGHRQPDGSWDLQCGDSEGETGCGWSIITKPGLTDDELDAIVDSHMEKNNQ